MKSKGQRHLYALDLSAALVLTAVYVSFARLPAAPASASSATACRLGGV